MTKKTTYTYENDRIEVKWDKAVCIHAEECVNTLPEVFKPDERPWIDVDAADNEAIKEAVNACPTGALAYTLKNESESDEDSSENEGIEIRVQKGGPLLVLGNFKMPDADVQAPLKKDRAAFCRCGQSGNMPFCDGSHTSSDFDA